MTDNPPFDELADDDDELDSTGIDFKEEPLSDDELDSLLEDKDA